MAGHLRRGRGGFLQPCGTETRPLRGKQRHCTDSRDAATKSKSITFFLPQPSRLVRAGRGSGGRPELFWKNLRWPLSKSAFKWNSADYLMFKPWRHNQHGRLRNVSLAGVKNGTQQGPGHPARRGDEMESLGGSAHTQVNPGPQRHDLSPRPLKLLPASKSVSSPSLPCIPLHWFLIFIDTDSKLLAAEKMHKTYIRNGKYIVKDIIFLPPFKEHFYLYISVFITHIPLGHSKSFCGKRQKISNFILTTFPLPLCSFSLALWNISNR